VKAGKTKHFETISHIDRHPRHQSDI